MRGYNAANRSLRLTRLSTQRGGYQGRIPWYYGQCENEVRPEYPYLFRVARQTPVLSVEEPCGTSARRVKSRVAGESGDNRLWLWHRLHRVLQPCSAYPARRRAYIHSFLLSTALLLDIYRKTGLHASQCKNFCSSTNCKLVIVEFVDRGLVECRRTIRGVSLLDRQYVFSPRPFSA